MYLSINTTYLGWSCQRHTELGLDFPLAFSWSNESSVTTFTAQDTEDIFTSSEHEVFENPFRISVAELYKTEEMYNNLIHKTGRALIVKYLYDLG